MVADESSEVRAHLYRAEGLLTNEQESTRALAAFEAAIAIHRAAGNRLELARCLLGVSLACNVLDRFEEAVRAAEEARDIALEVGDLRTEGAAIGNLGWAAIQHGDAEEGAKLNLIAIDLVRQAGDLHGAVVGLAANAAYTMVKGDIASALDQHLAALEMARQLGDPEMVGLELINLVIPYVKLGRWREAIEPWIEGVTLLQGAGIEWIQVASLSIAVSLLHAAGDAQGAAQTWAAANALAAERNLTLQGADIDDEAVAAIEGATPGNGTQQPRAGVRLEEAVDFAKLRIGVLGGSDG